MTEAEPADDGIDMSAAELALGVLDGPERSAAEARVRSDPAFAREVEVWRTHLAGLFAAWPGATPPADAADRLLRTVPRGLHARIRQWQVATGIATAAAAALLATLLLGPRPVPMAPPVAGRGAAPLLLAALAPGTDAPPVAAAYDPARGEIRLAPAQFAPAGRSAQLWAIGADGVPHSLGLMVAGGDTVLPLDPARRARIVSGVTLAVSVEAPGGSTTGTPQGPVVATGIFS